MDTVQRLARRATELLWKYGGDVPVWSPEDARYFQRADGRLIYRGKTAPAGTPAVAQPLDWKSDLKRSLHPSVLLDRIRVNFPQALKRLPAASLGPVGFPLDPELMYRWKQLLGKARQSLSNPGVAKSLKKPVP